MTIEYSAGRKVKLSEDSANNGRTDIVTHYGPNEEIARREGVTLSGYRLVLNQGEDSGQEIPHPHMHLLGGKKLGAMG